MIYIKTYDIKIFYKTGTIFYTIWKLNFLLIYLTETVENRIYFRRPFTKIITIFDYYEYPNEGWIF